MRQPAPSWVESWVTQLHEPELDESVLASVSTTGEWIVSALRECQGKAETVEAGKLAALGAMSGMVPWHREWSAQFAGHELLILELEEWERENPTRPFLWHFAFAWPHRRSGVARTLEIAKAAVLRAAREHERRQSLARGNDQSIIRGNRSTEEPWLPKKETP